MSKAAAKGAVLVGCGSPKKTVIYFPWAMKLALFFTGYPQQMWISVPDLQCS